jgi:flagellar biosynthesis protein FlhF
MSNATSTDPGSIHTYRGRTVEELLPRIQDELGSGAIIVRRREGLTGGIAGFFQRRFVELEATEGGPRIDVYDEPAASDAPSYTPERELPLQRRAAQKPEALSPFDTQQENPRRTYGGSPAHTPFYAREPLRLQPNGAYVSERLAALAQAGPLEPARPPALEPGGHGARAQREAPDPDDPFALMLERASSLEREPPSSPRPSAGTAPAQRRAPAPALPLASGRARAKILEGLLALGVGEQFAAELIDGAAVHIRPFAPRASLAQAVRSALTQRIPVAPPLPSSGAAIVLVGPGGAGKTSCCAALLGAYRKGSALPASCATLVRGQAGGELRMLLSPYVMKPTAIDTTRAVRALRKTKSEGLLVIDTPPLSPGDRSGIRKLASLLTELEPERVVVALPATLSAVAAAQLLQALRPLNANALALTHADDTNQLGMAVEAACRFALAPEYTLARARAGGWTVGRLDPAGLAAKLVR